MTLNIISLGAGVQSTTMALMAAHGEITPMPDCAIFADTGDEKRATYRHLAWLADKLPYPIITVTRFDKTLAEYTLEYYGSGDGSCFTPGFYTRDPDGMLPPRCSKEFKVRAITAKIREMVGLGPGQRGPKETAVECWIGMTTDEASRMKPAEAPWVENRWPLVELRMHRHDCGRWLGRNGYSTPPKSACVYCPFHDNEQWKDMHDNPADDDWERAVAFDRAIRYGGPDTEGTLYVHRQAVPLEEADLRSADDRRGQLNMFINECEGMCGV